MIPQERSRVLDFRIATTVAVCLRVPLLRTKVDVSMPGAEGGIQWTCAGQPTVRALFETRRRNLCGGGHAQLTRSSAVSTKGQRKAVKEMSTKGRENAVKLK